MFILLTSDCSNIDFSNGRFNSVIQIIPIGNSKFS